MHIPTRSNHAIKSTGSERAFQLAHLNWDCREWSPTTKRMPLKPTSNPSRFAPLSLSDISAVGPPIFARDWAGSRSRDLHRPPGSLTLPLPLRLSTVFLSTSPRLSLDFHSLLPSHAVGLHPCRSRHVSQWVRESRHRRGLPERSGRRRRMVSSPQCPLLRPPRRAAHQSTWKFAIADQLALLGSCCTTSPEMR